MRAPVLTRRARVNSLLACSVGTLIGLVVSLPLWLGLAFLLAKFAHEIGWVP